MKTGPRPVAGRCQSREDIKRAQRRALEESLKLAASYGGGNLHNVSAAILDARDAMRAEIDLHESTEAPAPYCLWCKDDDGAAITPWPCPTVDRLRPALAAIDRILPDAAREAEYLAPGF